MYWDFENWTEMEQLRREMDSLFSGYNRAAGVATFPLLNAYDDQNKIVITAELPGLTKNQVDITYAEGALTLSGKADPVPRVKDLAVVRQERSLGAFEKTIRIPVKIYQDKINASFTNGILAVTLPKAEEAKPKTIAIGAK